MITLRDVKNYWNTTHVRNAHFGLNGESEMLSSRYARYVTSSIDVKGRCVLDFGCGGGLLGLHVLREHDASRYVGIDVSARSLRRARDVLISYGERLRLVEVTELASLTFSEYEPYVVVCLSCMMHFPDPAYLEYFLQLCDASLAAYIVLEYRSSSKTRFVARYSTPHDVKWACVTSREYIVSKLTNYSLATDEQGQDDGTTRVLSMRRLS